MSMTDREKSMLEGILKLTDAKIKISRRLSEEQIEGCAQNTEAMLSAICELLGVKIVEQKFWCKKHNRIESEYITKTLTSEEISEIKMARSERIVVGNAEEFAKRQREKADDESSDECECCEHLN